MAKKRTGKPELSEGYIRISNELYMAIMLADFSKIELNIILAIIHKTYGFNKSIDCISAGQIGQITSIGRSSIVRSINGLISKNVIISKNMNKRLPARKLGINKYYRKWKPPIDIKTGAKTAPVEAQTGVKTAPVEDDNSEKKDDQLVSKQHHYWCQNSTTTGAKTAPQLVPKQHQQKTQDKLKDTLKNKTVEASAKSEQNEVAPKISKKERDQAHIFWWGGASSDEKQASTKSVQYPEWLNVELFQAYVENRIFMKSPMSPNAQNIAIKKLSELIDAGNDPDAVIEKAISSNWKSFYPITTQDNAAKHDSVGHAASQPNENGKDNQRRQEFKSATQVATESLDATIRGESHFDQTDLFDEGEEHPKSSVHSLTLVSSNNQKIDDDIS